MNGKSVMNKRLIKFLGVFMIVFILLSLTGCGFKNNLKTFDVWLANTYIAHRGFHSSVAPENTMPAFESAVNNNYAIELDIHLIADGTLAVFHDEDLKRLTGQNGKIKDLTKDDLKTHYINSTVHTIPTLPEVLTFVDGRVPLLIEIKNTNQIDTLCMNFMTVIKDYNGEFAVQSFNADIVMWFKINEPGIMRGWLAGSFNYADLQVFKQISPDFLACSTNSFPIRQYIQNQIEVPILCWTIKSQSEYNRYKHYANNIIFENFTPA